MGWKDAPEISSAAPAWASAPEINAPALRTEGMPGSRQGFLAQTGTGLVSLADTTIGGALPMFGSVVQAGVRPFTTPQQAEQMGGAVTSALEKPFGKLFGVTDQPAYNQEMSRKVMDFIGQNVNKGADWIASKTGMPVEDVRNMLGTATVAVTPKVVNAMAPVAKGVLTAAEAPFAARAARTQETNVAKSYQNAPRIDAAKDALDLGIALNPATTNPTTGNKFRVAVVGSDTLDTKLAQHNLPQYTNIAKEDLGLPSTVKLDAKAFEQSRARPEVSGPYEAVRKLSAIAPDASTMDALENMKVTPLIGDEGQAANVNGFIDKVKQQLEQGVDGKTLVDSIRQRRRDAQAVYKQQSAGVNPPSPEAIARADVNLGIANTLEGLIESNISSDPKLLAAFRDARTAMAKTYDYERATNFATGQIDPQVIARMAAEGKPMSGKLAQIGNVAANFPEVSKGGVTNEPTWRETLPRSGAAGTAGALLGSPLGLPGSIAGGALGAAAGNVASGALARNMVKPGFQKANVVPPDYRPNALSPANRNALSK